MNTKENNVIKYWKNNRVFRRENDRLKEKKLVFVNYPVIKYSMMDISFVRPFVISDLFNRYYRMKGYEVIYSLGTNTMSREFFSNQAKDFTSIMNLVSSLSETYLHDLENLGIGFDQDISINTSSKEFTKYVEEIFLTLYKKGFIKYGLREVLIDQNEGKICYPINAIKVNKNYFSAISDNELIKKTLNVFYLDFSSFEEEILEMILNEKNPSLVVSTLSKLFSFNSGYTFDFFDELNERIVKVNTKHPEGVYGSSFLLGNIDYLPLENCSIEDKALFESFLLSSDKFFLTPFSYMNPVTHQELPLILTKEKTNGLELGIPDLEASHFEIAEEFSFERKEILNGGFLINSDFLDGMKEKKAKEEAIKNFEALGFGTVFHYLDNKEIVISSLDKWGIYIPLFYNDNKELVLLSETKLPILVNNRLDPIIPELTEPLNLIKETLNSLFVRPLIGYAIRTKSKLGILSPFLKENETMFSPFRSVDLLVLDSSNVLFDYIMPKLLEMMFKKLGLDLGFALPENTLIIERTLDVFGLEMNKKNNNLITLESISSVIGSDILRLYLISKPLKEFLFSTEELQDTKELLQSIISVFNLLGDDNRLNNDINLFVKSVNEALEKKDTYNYFLAIQKMVRRIHKIGVISPKNAFAFLKVISIVIPFNSEIIYREVLKKNNYLVYEEFPCFDE